MEIAKDQYQKLGHKTLLMFMFKRSALFLLLLLIFLVCIFLSQYIPASYFYIAVNMLLVYAIVLVFFLLGVLLLAWLEYSHYSIFLEETDFKVTKGMVSQEEMGIPYKRIKEVKIERGPFDQIVGVSNVIITVLGDVESQSSPEGSRIILPSISKEIAQQIQDSLLKKAEVEEVDIAKP